uniref:Oogenesis-related gene n=1 Tax=Paramormyrops kingsleyae TaxID=1676925 RepID=A0A3B3TGU3_9TELE|nr:uncharacterized protein LOC111860360 [Paramormyrops kingsleyae]
MSSQCSYTIEPESSNDTQDAAVARKDGVLSAFLRRLSQSWPVRFTMRALNGFWWLLGFSRPEISHTSAVQLGSPPARQCRTGRKRLRRITRLFLAVLPRRVQSLLGYPVCTSIGCSVSPDVRCSPTKPCGKGSKRKQDDVDEDDEQPSWVEALTEELADEDCQEDPDYEPSTLETDSEEYRTHNDTESDIEIEKVGNIARIKDLLTDVVPDP